MEVATFGGCNQFPACSQSQSQSQDPVYSGTEPSSPPALQPSSQPRGTSRAQSAARARPGCRCRGSFGHNFHVEMAKWDIEECKARLPRNFCSPPLNCMSLRSCGKMVQISIFSGNVSPPRRPSSSPRGWQLPRGPLRWFPMCSCIVCRFVRCSKKNL